MSTAADAIAAPSELPTEASSWIAAPVPGTAAQALQLAGQWHLDQYFDFDAHDWWYRCTFAGRAVDASVHRWLSFEGLATLAEVWLNGQSILTSDNMFQRHVIDVSALLRDNNELVVVFRALSPALARPRARPRWKTKLVVQQQLRWFRTTLLGRIPGWSPPVAPVGPWRGVTIEHRRPETPTAIDVRSYLDDSTGVVEFSCHLALSAEISVTAELTVGDASGPLHVERDASGYRIVGSVRVANPSLWWPHTHGIPQLHPCSARIVVNGTAVAIDCGSVGFRRIDVRNDNGDFELRVNGVPIFCRGACWTVSDIVSLAGTAATLSHSLRLMQWAGANMLRIGGTMLYEDSSFYRLCDQLGILVWQDFMFANMDYPVDDAAFQTSVRTEVTQQLQRLRRHTCVAVYCGNSEVEQQAAMLGIARDAWRSPLFSQILPELCERWHPGTPYVASTPSGGTLPFHVGTGITHYYGVGAYLRPVSEVRRAKVRFTPECLGFANVPEKQTIDLLMDGATPVTHDPRWKRRTPRDTGAGWDFEDVRDHYLAQLFATDPVRLRCFDPDRYLALARVTTGEMMSQVFSEWRSAYNSCHGALVWFLKDLWPGAGWGILDSCGIPKACFYYLRRAWQPQTVLLTDELLDGVHAHVINESDRVLTGTLELMLLRDERVVTARAKTACHIAPRSKAAFAADALFDGFYDTSYVYRFGPPKHDVVIATLLDEQGGVIAEAFHFPGASEPERRGATVSAEARRVGDNAYEVMLTSDRFLYAVHFDSKGFVADDNYFHLPPDRKKVVKLQSVAGDTAKLRGYVEALNLEEAVRIVVKDA
ncbi:MAG: glycoside hydrolase family 2 protein [Gammaproteobacteria bacterium]|nr:glycoside hydrolase family 2 protein [Gammaproteobacteria bacterium]